MRPLKMVNHLVLAIALFSIVLSRMSKNALLPSDLDCSRKQGSPAVTAIRDRPHSPSFRQIV
jgi:hypothetical protein